MNRKVFFDHIRKSVFSGSLSANQVDGVTRILDYRDEKWPDMPDTELAYLLATAKWETASTMQPVVEYGSQKYLRNKRYWPWIGRGLVQITWERNYKKYGITDPAQALEWPTALHVIFHGMIYGTFTGKKLADYIGSGSVDYRGARRIINGTDKASKIAAIARAFLAAFEMAAAVDGDPAAETAPPIEADAPQLPKPASKSTTIWSQIVNGGTALVSPVLTFLVGVDWKIVLILTLAMLVVWLASGHAILERLKKLREHGI